MLLRLEPEFTRNLDVSTEVKNESLCANHSVHQNAAVNRLNSKRDLDSRGDLLLVDDFTRPSSQDPLLAQPAPGKAPKSYA